MLFDLCQYIYENDQVRGKDLKEFGHKGIQKAIDLSLVEKKNQYYVLTDKGIQWLKAYRVENAIILASGYGSRFIPFTYDTPHGLLEVRGEPLVERQIKQLKKVGIHDITVVVGYYAKQFEYLKNLYDVNLVYNPNFRDDFDISSLSLVSEHLARTYILTADLYIGDWVLKNHEYRSWYGALRHRVLLDGHYPVLQEDGRFISVEKRSPNHQWILKGPLFFDRKTSEHAKKILEESRRLSFPEFFNRLLKKSTITLKDLNAQDVYRLDTIESLRAFDRTYLGLGKHETLDVIAHVFKVKPDEIFDIRPMEKGMTNRSFLFSIGNRRYVFRVPGRGTSELISRSEEAEVYQNIDLLDIADEIIYINPIKGYKITRFYDGVETLDDEDIEQVKKAMQILRDLHEADIQVKHHFDLETEIKTYLNICEKEKISYYENHDNVLPKIEKLLVYTQQYANKLRLCHIDSVKDNFLVLKDESIRLIDWEYAGMADPYLDIAMFAIYSYYNKDEIDLLLELYLDRKPSKKDFALFYGYISLAGFLWSLWTQYKESLGEYYGEYGPKQFEYAQVYSDLALNYFEELGNSEH